MQSIPVVPGQLRRTARVQTLEEGEAARPVTDRLKGCEAEADCIGEGRVGLGGLGPPLHQPTQIHRGAAAQNRRLPSIEHLANRTQRVAVKLAGSVLIHRIAQIDQVVLDSLHLTRRRLVRANLQPAVHLHRVH